MSTSMTTQEAVALGRQAYADGKPAAACTSPEIMAAIAGNQVGDAETMRILTAYQRGWVAACLADDNVPTDSDSDEKRKEDGGAAATR